MSTTGGALPIATTVPTTDDQWLQWALTVFGGNHARATAAAAAAAQARRAGASSDALFAAAHAAYNNPNPLAGATAEPMMSAKVVFKDTGARVIRPTGRSALGITVAVILLGGIIDVFARLQSSYVAPVILVLALIFGGWFALSLRSSVRVIGDTVAVQGLLQRHAFPRIDVRRITVQPRSRKWLPRGGPNGPIRGQFLASFVGEDCSHLFELRQGAWTRADINRIGAAIGVDVVVESTPSIT